MPDNIQLGLVFDAEEQPTNCQKALKWMDSPGGRHVLRDLYALAAVYAQDWKRYGIQISMKMIFENERHAIKKCRAGIQKRGKSHLLKPEYGYTLNNTYTAFCARHILSHKPEWAGLFETRQLDAHKSKIVSEVTVRKYAWQ